jgi:hypothetical protein
MELRVSVLFSYNGGVKHTYCGHIHRLFPDFLTLYRQIGPWQWSTPVVPKLIFWRHNQNTEIFRVPYTIWYFKKSITALTQLEGWTCLFETRRLILGWIVIQLVNNLKAEVFWFNFCHEGKLFFTQVDRGGRVFGKLGKFVRVIFSWLLLRLACLQARQLMKHVYKQIETGARCRLIFIVLRGNCCFLVYLI